ncbi:TRAP transporter substrate-binding protein DctP [Sulfitobacter geojensis]|uniref:TRAP transporter substrate-binding protein DctP n=1 Tax=Sulfitobacter geojensis TaxID=1342299 RepID=UPI0009DDEAA6|nr:TRAP transporter substrate-binding protein DctP [Sulfitobacter geojensis]KHA54086.1 TRAP dicarboxylate transporter, DctP subunit [Sulfitobacter geojensis]NYI29904.1 TRAP-type C4-dicarboxylate transport system substrate-binding protein [Sulfitobacter geojensis]
MWNRRIMKYVAGLAVGLAAQGAMAQDVKWDLALFGSPAFRVAGEAFADYVNQNSDGKMEIVVHNGTLSPSREILDNVSIGAFQLGYVISSYHPGKNPLISVLDLPFLPIDSMEARMEISEALYKNEMVLKEFAKWNSMPMMGVVMPHYEIMGKGDVPKTLEDFDGLRIKATSGMGDALARFGVSLVPLSGSEQYNGLQTGVIDAAAATPSGLGGAKLYEVADWYTVGMSTGSANVTLVVNADAYQGLPEELKAVLDDAKAHAYAETIKAQNGAAESYQPAIEAAGLTRFEVPKEMVDKLRAEAAKPVWDAYVEDMESKGLPGQELLDFVLNWK